MKIVRTINDEDQCLVKATRFSLAIAFYTIIDFLENDDR